MSNAGHLVFVKKNGKMSEPYYLETGDYRIGSSLDSDIRLKFSHPLVKETKVLLAVNENGIATLSNECQAQVLNVNNKPMSKAVILSHEDTFDILGKVFKYFNERQKNNAVSKLCQRITTIQHRRSIHPIIKDSFKVSVMRDTKNSKPLTPSRRSLSPKCKTESKIPKPNILATNVKKRRLSLGLFKTTARSSPKVSSKNTLIKSLDLKTEEQENTASQVSLNKKTPRRLNKQIKQKASPNSTIKRSEAESVPNSSNKKHRSFDLNVNEVRKSIRNSDKAHGTSSYVQTTLARKLRAKSLPIIETTNIKKSLRSSKLFKNDRAARMSLRKNLIMAALPEGASSNNVLNSPSSSTRKSFNKFLNETVNHFIQAEVVSTSRRSVNQSLTTFRSSLKTPSTILSTVNNSPHSSLDTLDTVSGMNTSSRISRGNSLSNISSIERVNNLSVISKITEKTPQQLRNQKLSDVNEEIPFAADTSTINSIFSQTGLSENTDEITVNNSTLKTEIFSLRKSRGKNLAASEIISDSPTTSPTKLKGKISKVHKESSPWVSDDIDNNEVFPDFTSLRSSLRSSKINLLSQDSNQLVEEKKKSAVSDTCLKRLSIQTASPRKSKALKIDMPLKESSLKNSYDIDSYEVINDSTSINHEASLNKSDINMSLRKYKGKSLSVLNKTHIDTSLRNSLKSSKDNLSQTRDLDTMDNSTVRTESPTMSKAKNSSVFNGTLNQFDIHMPRKSKGVNKSNIDKKLALRSSNVNNTSLGSSDVNIFQKHLGQSDLNRIKNNTPSPRKSKGKSSLTFNISYILKESTPEKSNNSNACLTAPMINLEDNRSEKYLEDTDLKPTGNNIVLKSPRKSKGKYLSVSIDSSLNDLNIHTASPRKSNLPPEKSISYMANFNGRYLDGQFHKAYMSHVDKSKSESDFPLNKLMSPTKKIDAAVVTESVIESCQSTSKMNNSLKSSSSRNSKSASLSVLMVDSDKNIVTRATLNSPKSSHREQSDKSLLANCASDSVKYTPVGSSKSKNVSSRRSLRSALSPTEVISNSALYSTSLLGTTKSKNSLAINSEEDTLHLNVSKMNEGPKDKTNMRHSIFNETTQDILSPVKRISGRPAIRPSRNNNSHSCNESSLNTVDVEESLTSVISVSSQSFSTFQKNSGADNMVPNTPKPTIRKSTRINQAEKGDTIVSNTPKLTAGSFNNVFCTSTPFCKPNNHSNEASVDNINVTSHFELNPKTDDIISISSESGISSSVNTSNAPKRRSSRRKKTIEYGNHCISCNEHSEESKAANKTTSVIELSSTMKVPETPILHKITSTPLTGTHEKQSMPEEETPKSAVKSKRLSSKLNTSIYNPIVEDITPVTPEKLITSGFTEEAFKTPVNTPGLFESIKESVIKSRKRRRETNGSFIKEYKKVKMDTSEKESIKIIQKSPKNDLTNIPNLRPLLSPKIQRSPKNDLRDVVGVKRIFQKNSPLNDLTKVPNIKDFVSLRRSPKNDLTNLVGVKRIFQHNSPKNDLSNIPNLKGLITLKQNSPHNDLNEIRGTKYSFRKSKVNDFKNIPNLRKLMSPKVQTSPRNDLTDVSGLTNIFNVSGVDLLQHRETDMENSEDLFCKLTGLKPLRAYRGKSLSPNKIQSSNLLLRKTMGDIPLCSPRVQQWINEQTSFVPNIVNEENDLTIDMTEKPKHSSKKSRSLSSKKLRLAGSHCKEMHGDSLNMSNMKSEPPKLIPLNKVNSGKNDNEKLGKGGRHSNDSAGSTISPNPGSQKKKRLLDCIDDNKLTTKPKLDGKEEHIDLLQVTKLGIKPKQTPKTCTPLRKSKRVIEHKKGSNSRTIESDILNTETQSSPITGGGKNKKINLKISPIPPLTNVSTVENKSNQEGDKVDFIDEKDEADVIETLPEKEKLIKTININPIVEKEKKRLRKVNFSITNENLLEKSVETPTVKKRMAGHGSRKTRQANININIADFESPKIESKKNRRCRNVEQTDIHSELRASHVQITRPTRGRGIQFQKTYGKDEITVEDINEKLTLQKDISEFRTIETKTRKRGGRLGLIDEKDSVGTESEVVNPPKGSVTKIIKLASTVPDRSSENDTGRTGRQVVNETYYAETGNEVEKHSKAKTAKVKKLAVKEKDAEGNNKNATDVEVEHLPKKGKHRGRMGRQVVVEGGYSSEIGDEIENLSKRETTKIRKTRKVKEKVSGRINENESDVDFDNLSKKTVSRKRYGRQVLDEEKGSVDTQAQSSKGRTVKVKTSPVKEKDAQGNNENDTMSVDIEVEHLVKKVVTRGRKVHLVADQENDSAETEDDVQKYSKVRPTKVRKVTPAVKEKVSDRNNGIDVGVEQLQKKIVTRGRRGQQVVDEEKVSVGLEEEIEKPQGRSKVKKAALIVENSPGKDNEILSKKAETRRKRGRNVANQGESINSEEEIKKQREEPSIKWNLRRRN